MVLNSVRELLPPAQAHYRGTAGNRLKFYNDASEDAQGLSGAFADIALAIQQAERFVFIVDWSFHPLLTLQRRRVDEESVGALLLRKALAEPDLLVAIMPWKHITSATGDTANNDGPQALERLHGAPLPANLLYKLAPYKGGVLYSHHQKFVVLDAPASSDDPHRRIIKAFFGGLDLTTGRFDWQEHPILRDKNVTFLKDWYNGEFAHDQTLNREPWHDIHAQVAGPVAWDFISEFVARWSVIDPDGDRVLRCVASLYDNDRIVQADEPLPEELPDPDIAGDWNAQLLHSISTANWKTPKSLDKLANPIAREALTPALTWSLPGGATVECSVQDAYLKMIDSADEFIYIESQYLISSGLFWDDTVYGKARPSVANLVAERLVARILDHAHNGQDFHVYVVLPMYPEGPPDSASLYAVRYLQWVTMEYMIQAVAAGTENWSRYLSFHCLAQWTDTFEGAEFLPRTPEGNTDWSKALMYPASVTERRHKVAIARRYMVYVHSKAMIVDDRYAIIGSANLNERSLNGDRDTEIAVALWPTDPGQPAPQLAAFRKRIWSEHLGRDWLESQTYDQPNGELPPGSLQAVELFQSAARLNFIDFMKGERTPSQTGHLVNFPVSLGQQGRLEFDRTLIGEIPNDFIPDYPEQYRDSWRWAAGASLFSWFLKARDIPE